MLFSNDTNVVTTFVQPSMLQQFTIMNMVVHNNAHACCSTTKQHVFRLVPTASVKNCCCLTDPEHC